MRLVKVKKRVFKREFLDFKLIVLVFDICELVQEGDETIVDVNRVYYVLPMMKGDQIDEKMISKLIR
ncbi:MAG: hypothetical protein NT120_04375 [Candidatus Aenigmarchaeota archaeon]|nr:hypothetical protein [Candidatus Aenigmarchaeota archaeon]